MNPKQPTFLNVQLQGLNTFQSELSAVPEGSLIRADNVNLDKEGILETRRGIGTKLNIRSIWTDGLPASVHSLHPFKDSVLMHVQYFDSEFNDLRSQNVYIAPSDLSTAENKLWDIAPSNQPDFKLRTATFRSNMYLTSSTGVRKLEDPDRNIIQTGVPKAFALDYGITGVLDPEDVQVIEVDPDEPLPPERVTFDDVSTTIIDSSDITPQFNPTWRAISDEQSWGSYDNGKYLFMGVEAEEGSRNFSYASIILDTNPSSQEFGEVLKGSSSFIDPLITTSFKGQVYNTGGSRHHRAYETATKVTGQLGGTTTDYVYDYADKIKYDLSEFSTSLDSKGRRRPLSGSTSSTRATAIDIRDLNTATENAGFPITGTRAGLTKFISDDETFMHIVTQLTNDDGVRFQLATYEVAPGASVLTVSKTLLNRNIKVNDTGIVPATSFGLLSIVMSKEVLRIAYHPDDNDRSIIKVRDYVRESEDSTLRLDYEYTLYDVPADNFPNDLRVYLTPLASGNRVTFMNRYETPKVQYGYIDLDEVRRLQERHVPTETATATRDEDPFQVILNKDQDVDLLATDETVELIFANDIVLPGDVPQIHEISIPENSGLDGEAGVYPVLDHNNNKITIPNTATDFPQVDYTIPRGNIAIEEDLDNSSNMIIVLPETESPPQTLVNRQLYIRPNTLPDAPETLVTVSAVNENKITVPRITGFLTNRITYKAGTKVKVELDPDKNLITLFGLLNINLGQRHEITFPMGFLGLEAPVTLISEDTPVFKDRSKLTEADIATAVTFKDSFLSKQQAALTTNSDSTITINASVGIPTFSWDTDVYLRLSPSNTTPSEGTTLRDISGGSSVQIPIESIELNPFETGDAKNAQAVTLNISSAIYRSPPSITNGVERISGADTTGGAVWVRFSRDSIPAGAPFKRHGIVKQYRNTAERLDFRLESHIVLSSRFNTFRNRKFTITLPNSIVGGTEEINVNTDWVHVSNNSFIGNTFPPMWEEIQAPITDLQEVRDQKAFSFTVSRELHRKYGGSGSRTLLQGAVTVYRPLGRITSENPLVIQTEPVATLELKSDLIVTLLDREQELFHPIQIGRYSGDKRLIKDLRVYQTAKDVFIAGTDSTEIIQSIKVFPNEEKVTLTFKELDEGTRDEFNEVLETATQIFIAEGSTFLGTPGIDTMDIIEVQEQTDTPATITLSTLGFDITQFQAFEELGSGFSEGPYIIGNFNIGRTVAGVTDDVAVALQPNRQYSYKMLWFYEDANSNRIVGAPSEQLLVTRPESSRAVNLDLIVTVPDEILNSGRLDDYTFEIYRSSGSANASTVPRQDEGLIHTGAVEYDIVTEKPFKRMVIEDKNPELSRGKTIYTSPLQEGVEGTNSRPPIALDIAEYKEHLFYANTVHPSSMEIRLKGTGPTSLEPTENVRSKGPQRGEWIAINPRNVNNIEEESDTIFFFASNRFEGRDILDEGKSGSDPREFKNFFKISDNESPALAIAETARSLVRVINLHEELGIEAIYISSENDFPGRIALRHKTPSSELFTVRSNAGFVSHNPQIDDTWAPSLRGARNSDLNRKPNGLFFSKYREPEAVPLLNFVEIGSSDQPILRIIPLRESLFVFTTGGVYRLTGDNPRNLTIEPFDLTIKLLAPESAVALANSIYCLTNQGVVSINDNGLKIESRPVEDVIQRILLSPHVDKCFAVAYESDRKYILNLPNADGNIEEQYVLNIITQGWTRWTIAALSGIVLNDKLILADIGKIKEERKTGTQNDYQDELGEPISTRVEWTTIHAEAPDQTKHFAEARVFFREAPRNQKNRVQLGFNTEKSTETEYVPLYLPEHHLSQGFGREAYGTQPYGSVVIKEEAITRTYVPRNKQKAALMHLKLTHDSLKDSMALTGVSVSMRDISVRTDK